MLPDIDWPEDENEGDDDSEKDCATEVKCQSPLFLPPNLPPLPVQNSDRHVPLPLTQFNEMQKPIHINQPVSEQDPQRKENQHAVSLGVLNKVRATINKSQSESDEDNENENENEDENENENESESDSRSALLLDLQKQSLSKHDVKKNQTEEVDEEVILLRGASPELIAEWHERVHRFGGPEIQPFQSVTPEKKEVCIINIANNLSPKKPRPSKIQSRDYNSESLDEDNDIPIYVSNKTHFCTALLRCMLALCKR